jgi:tetratricopeptide (TPR) repeat protein
LLVGALFSTCSTSEEPPEIASAAEAQAQEDGPADEAMPAQKAEPSGASETSDKKDAGEQEGDPSVIAKANQASLDRFHVAPEQEMKDCKELVGNQGRGTPRQASDFWKAARTKLVQGDTEAAHEFMCRSALIDPSGGAAEGLVGFYLGRRSLTNAENWVKRVLAADPDRRTAKELQSDIRNQQGNPEEALTLLLETLKLTEGDRRKRQLVSRKFFADALASERSGDWPRAERLLRRAVILDEDNFDAATELAEVFLREALPKAATLWAEFILSRDKAHSGAHMVLGDIARLAKDYPKAREHYKQVQPGTSGAGRAEGYLQDMPM